MMPRAICLALAIITLLVYLPVRHYGFIAFDDVHYLVDNSMVQAGLTGAGFQWAFTTFHVGNWHPLTWLSHMFDSELFGPDAGGHHLMSVLFHIANSVLVFLWLRRLTGKLWPAAAVAALFAWHPLHVESVAWVSERKDVLSTLFWILTLWAYTAHAQSGAGKTPNAFTGFTSKNYWLALAFFILGLLSKPMLVTLPFVMLLLDFWPLNRIDFNNWRGRVLPLALEKWPFFALSIASSAVTYLAQRTDAVVSLQEYPLSWRLGNAVQSYADYLLKTIWPENLAVLYPEPTTMAWHWVAIAGLVLGVISVLAWISRKSQPYLLMGWLWFLGTLVPVIGLVKVGSQAMADRYTYVPLIGVFVMLAWAGAAAIEQFRIRRDIPFVAMGLISLVCLTLTSAQLSHWEDSETVFRRAMSVTRNNVIACLGYADAVARKGRTAEAVTAYEEVLRVAPTYALGQNNYANFLAATGQLEEALKYRRNAVALEPNSAMFRLNLAILLIERREFDEAWQHAEAAARAVPREARARFLMGKARYLQGRSSEAIEPLQHALRLNANSVEALTLLCRIQAADPDQKNRNGSAAVALGERARELSRDADPAALDALAMAYAEVRQFDHAVATIGAAITMVSGFGGTNQILELQARQRLYQAQQPYRYELK